MLCSHCWPFAEHLETAHLRSRAWSIGARRGFNSKCLHERHFRDGEPDVPGVSSFHQHRTKEAPQNILRLLSLSELINIDAEGHRSNCLAGIGIDNRSANLALKCVGAFVEFDIIDEDLANSLAIGLFPLGFVTLHIV